MSFTTNQHMMIFQHYYSERARADPVNTNYQITNKIEAVQYNAALAITGCIRSTFRAKLFSQLCLTSLYDKGRFHRRSLLQGFKSINTSISYALYSTFSS